MVSGGGFKLKITTKPKALDGQFGAKVLTPFILHVNKKLSASEQLSLEGLESVVVTTESASEVAAFRISESAPVLDLSATVQSLIPPGAAGEALNVEVAQRTARALKITCAGVSLTATLPEQHVHLSLHETVVKQFVMQYSDKVNAEQKPHPKANVTLKVTCHAAARPDFFVRGQRPLTLLPRHLRAPRAAARQLHALKLRSGDR